LPTKFSSVRWQNFRTLAGADLHRGDVIPHLHAIHKNHEFIADFQGGPLAERAVIMSRVAALYSPTRRHSMSEENALLAAIDANPLDDAPRLVYADWLDEQGGKPQAARAEFIRAQCELDLLPPADPRF